MNAEQFAELIENCQGDFEKIDGFVRTWAGQRGQPIMRVTLLAPKELTNEFGAEPLMFNDLSKDGINLQDALHFAAMLAAMSNEIAKAAIQQSDNPMAAAEWFQQMLTSGAVKSATRPMSGESDEDEAIDTSTVDKSN